MENIDIGKMAEEAFKKANAERGHINILIAGKTGVGKSTLINSVFQGNMATTGQGKPVTQETREITKEASPVSIFDTRGLETEKYKETLDELEKLVKERRNDPDVNRQIHVAWVCITEDSRRVEDAEINLVTMLSEYMPVIGIITKARCDNGFKAEVQKLLPQTKNIVRIRAISEIDDEGNELQQKGLNELIDLTEDVIPAGIRKAFAAAQKASLKQKVKLPHQFLFQIDFYLSLFK